MDAAIHLSAAVLRLSWDRPYLSALLWSTPIVAAPGIGTMAADQYGRVYYEPSAVTGWTVEEAAGVLYHELCHLIHDHAGRGASLENSYLWNLAADAEINDDLRQERVALPGNPIYPELFKREPGRLAEEYYRAQQRRRRPAATGVAAGRCGSAATGRCETWELVAANQVVELPDGLSPGELTLVRRRVAQAVREHARDRGSVPGHLHRWAEELLEPQVDWRRKLAVRLRRAAAHGMGAVDYTYRRPSRRQPAFGAVIVPSLLLPLLRVAVVVDTSGSMSGCLMDALAEVAGILRASGSCDGIAVLSVDTAVRSCSRVFRPEQIQLIGGGGTDLRAGFAAVARLRPRADLLIVLTDGWTAWPAHPLAGIQTVVVLIGTDAAAPAWARAVRVPVRFADARKVAS
jgi:predicted metal-dependent peptidase